MQEYTDQAKLKELVTKYSEFINYPIYLYSSKEVDVPVEDEEEEEKTAEEKKEEGAEDVEDEDGVLSCQV
jgi:heat shock protein 90kDa beta